jgi:hypothetical protein
MILCLCAYTAEAAQMSDEEKRWFEVWVDDGTDPPYLLLLRPHPNEPEGILIHDPKECYSVVYRACNYHSAQMWLLEEEYTLVCGRTFLDLD